MNIAEKKNAAAADGKVPADQPIGVKSKDDGRIPSRPSQDNRGVQLEAVRKSIAFTQIVSLLIRSPRHKAYALQDLEWLILPALQHNQFKIAEAKIKNMNIPAGFLLWARVSPEVDKRLTETLDAPIRLKPEEWNSGDILWAVEVLGDPGAIRPLLKALRDGAPNGRSGKMRSTSTNGEARVVALGDLNLAAEAPSSATA